MSTGNGTVFRIEKTKDFTTMSNHHLKNMSLTLKAKGLLSMILSLPENWDYSISGLASICKEGESALRNTIKELEEAGYIRRFQERDKAGKMGRVNFIVSEIPTLKNGLDSTSSPLDENPQADNPRADNPLADNSRQLNTKELNTKKSNTNQSFFPEESEEKALTGLERLEQTERMIKTQIEYEILEDRYKDERINELLEIILEVYLHEDEYFHIGKEKRLTALVKRRFYKLNFESIVSILDGLNDNTTQISDMKAYLLMCLYNAPAVVNNKVHAQVNHDFLHF